MPSRRRSGVPPALVDRVLAPGRVAALREVEPGARQTAGREAADHIQLVRPPTPTASSRSTFGEAALVKPALHQREDLLGCRLLTLAGSCVDEIDEEGADAVLLHGEERCRDGRRGCRQGERALAKIGAG